MKFHKRLLLIVLIAITLSTVFSLMFSSNNVLVEYSPIQDVDVKRNRHYGERILRYSNNHWTVTSDGCASENSDSEARAKLKITKSTKVNIFVHDQSKDKFVTGSLQNTGSWKGNLSEIIVDLLKRRPNSVLIDVGAHVGIFTIPAALAGFRVVAIDCLESSLQLLCQTCQKLGISSNVTLINNAVSHERGKALMTSLPDNLAGTSIEIVNRKLKYQKYDPSTLSDAIFLGDILDVVDMKSAVIKLSVEGRELDVLKGALDLFQTIHVSYVVMEFSQHKKRIRASHIHSLMETYGMVPDLSEELLTERYHTKWPDTVIWRNIKN